MVIGGHVYILLSGATRGPGVPVGRGPVAWPVKVSELLDVQVQQIARRFMLVAQHRPCRLQRGQPVQPVAGQPAPHGGRGHIAHRTWRQCAGSCSAGAAAQSFLERGLRHLMEAVPWPGRARVRARHASARDL